MDGSRQEEPVCCGICAEELDALNTYTAGDESVCRQCAQKDLVPKFMEALRWQWGFPVRWGADVLDPAAFADLLPAGFVAELGWKETEYGVPGFDRVYCKNVVMAEAPGEEFVKTYPFHRPYDTHAKGGLAPCEPTLIAAATAARVATTTCDVFLDRRGTKESLQCDYCRGWSCGRCGAPQGVEQAASGEICCTKDYTAEAQDMGAAVRGKDYQICPNSECKTLVALHDGCNHIVCHACSAELCFICGEPARHNSSHWKAGGCPRYNHPDDSNHLHDGDEVDGGVVGPAEGFAQDDDADEIARNPNAWAPWWHASENDMAGFPGNVVAALQAIDEEHAEAYVRSLGAGDSINEHYLARMVYENTWAMQESLIRVDAAELTDEELRSPTLTLEYWQTRLDHCDFYLEQVDPFELGPGWLADYPTLNDGIALLRSMYAHFEGQITQITEARTTKEPDTNMGIPGPPDIDGRMLTSPNAVLIDKTGC